MRCAALASTSSWCSTRALGTLSCLGDPVLTRLAMSYDSHELQTTGATVEVQSYPLSRCSGTTGLAIAARQRVTDGLITRLTGLDARRLPKTIGIRRYFYTSELPEARAGVSDEAAPRSAQ